MLSEIKCRILKHVIQCNCLILYSFFNYFETFDIKTFYFLNFFNLSPLRLLSFSLLSFSLLSFSLFDFKTFDFRHFLIFNLFDLFIKSSNHNVVIFTMNSQQEQKFTKIFKKQTQDYCSLYFNVCIILKLI